MTRLRMTGDRGTAAVELALVLPVLLVLILGMVGFGRAFHTQLELSNAAQEGARTLVFQVGATTADAVAATVASASVSPTLSASEVDVPQRCSPGAVVRVEASRTVSFSYYLGTFDRAIVGRAVMRCAG